MCGRFALTISPNVLARLFELDEVPDLSVRYNIAPAQPVAAVVCEVAERVRKVKKLQWGLVPPWAHERGIGSKMINARSETVYDKPAFREAFRNKRCLIPADGFYEWQKRAGANQPFFFRMRDGQCFAFAGLWERWEGTGEIVESCTILTTNANDLVRPVHNRMPVILPKAGYEIWLDTSLSQMGRVRKLLQPYRPEAMQCYPVSREVNRVGNEGPVCIEPLEKPGNENPDLFEN